MTTSDPSLPFERAVTCDCDSRFHLPLAFLISPDSDPAHACMRCGRITCTEVLWTHVHHNTFEPHGRREYPISDETRAWLDLWPRVVHGKDFEDYAFFPATTRCTDLADFERRSALVLAAAKSGPRGRRLREAGIPAAPPPETLPEPLKNYRTFWNYSRELTPERDASFLLNHARPAYRLCSALAIDAMLQRADLPELLARAASSGDHEDRATVCALVREHSAALPLALPHLLAWLAQFVSAPNAMLNDYRLHSLLDFFAEQKSAAAQIVPALEALKARLNRNQFEFSRKLTEIIRALNGEPPLPISTKPWFFG